MIELDSEFIFNEALKARIYDACIRTPIDFMPDLSERLANNIFVKREDRQKNNSFKTRGAVAKFNSCTDEELKNGVVTASAGNHAQGVAYAAKIRGVKAKIFMPVTTPSIKIQAVKKLNADIQLFGNSLAESLAEAKSYAKKNNAIYIQGYDDPYVIAGQGTIALEILQDSKTIPDIIFVPVGGGGLISGIALVAKKLYPKIKIIGVEPIDSNEMTQSIAKNEIITLNHMNTFAEGVAVARAGELNFKCCQQFVDGFVNVTSDEICFAIKLIYDDLRAIAEPSGAVSLAGAISFINTHHCHNKNIVVINSGANVDFDRFRYITERTNIGAGKELLLAVRLKEQAGTLKLFCKSILPELKITEFNYRTNDPKNAVIFIGITINDATDSELVFKRLAEFNYEYSDLTNDELAKNHIKYMIGGRLPANVKERVFQFNFTDGKYALTEFLNKVSSDWNISLFHYRSYGIDYGKIFIGIQADSDDSKLIEVIDKFGYSYKEKTEDLGYKLFLGK